MANQSELTPSLATYLFRLPILNLNIAAMIPSSKMSRHMTAKTLKCLLPPQARDSQLAAKIMKSWLTNQISLQKRPIISCTGSSFASEHLNKPKTKCSCIRLCVYFVLPGLNRR